MVAVAMSSGNVVFVGDIGWDTTVFVERMPEPDEKLFTRCLVESAGGVAANAAVACARTGMAAQAWVACGDDAVGDAACAQLASEGVAVTCDRRPGPTCRCVILLEPGGEKRLLLSPGVSMYPSAEMLAETSLEGIAWVHTAPYDVVAAETLVARCRKRGIPWSLDLEPATFAQDIGVLAGCLDGAAVVFCNARAAAVLGPDAAGALARLGARTVVFSRGAAGAVWCGGDRWFTAGLPPGLPSAIDTTGAGDCLAGWLVAESVRGVDPTEALRTAVAAASLSCSAAGAQPSFPTREAVTHWLGRLEPRLEANA